VASEAVHRELAGDFRLQRILQKDQRALLEESLQRIGPSEELLAFGLAGVALADAETTDTYYLVTDAATHFGRVRRAGFMKKVASTEVVPNSEIARAELLTPLPGVFVRCYRSGEEKHFLFFSFYLGSAEDEVAQAQVLLAALGQKPS
jgi:hypothetical protein